MTFNNAFATYNIVTAPSEEYINNITNDYFEPIYYQEHTYKKPEETPQQTIEVVKIPTKSKTKKISNNTTKYDHTISLEQLLKNIGANARISSGYREGSKTKRGTLSNHSQRDEYGQSKAHDIVPLDGDFNRLRQLLTTNPEARNWFQKRGYGIINEVNPEILSATGGTGKHFHIGPDNWAKLTYNTWLSNPNLDINIDVRKWKG